MLSNTVAAARADLSVNDVASRLGVCEKTVRRAIEDGKLRARVFAGRLRVSEADYDAFLAALPTRKRKAA